jgi:hypothetical protein
MAAAAVTISAARAAKNEAKRRFGRTSGVVGIGLTRNGDGYAVKVNLGPSVERPVLPDEVEGVPLVVEHVGAVAKR